jgi:alpha-tubulin suppressor-like RCC1 family protein
VSTGEVHSCALSGAAAYCWGHNLWLELGTGRSNGSNSTPQAVMKPLNANPQYTKISVGSGHSCALDSGGDIWCWGLSNMGQLGIGVANNWLAGSTWAQSFAGVGEPSKVVAP